MPLPHPITAGYDHELRYFYIRVHKDIKLSDLQTISKDYKLFNDPKLESAVFIKQR